MAADRYTLTLDEARYVVWFANEVDEATKRGQRRPQHGEEDRAESSFSRLRRGYAAEVAVARLYGLRGWLPTKYLKPGDEYRHDVDIPGIGNVRHATPERYQLLINEPWQDPPDEPFYLVTGPWDGELWLRGWRFAREVQVERWRNRRPNLQSPYAIPPGKLNDPFPLPMW